jgi:hypothetical protein
MYTTWTSPEGILLQGKPEPNRAFLSTTISITPAALRGINHAKGIPLGNPYPSFYESSVVPLGTKI